MARIQVFVGAQANVIAQTEVLEEAAQQAGWNTERIFEDDTNVARMTRLDPRSTLAGNSSYCIVLQIDD